VDGDVWNVPARVVCAAPILISIKVDANHSAPLAIIKALPLHVNCASLPASSVTMPLTANTANQVTFFILPTASSSAQLNSGL
jgi:hypothetical protein